MPLLMLPAREKRVFLDLLESVPPVPEKASKVSTRVRSCRGRRRSTKLISPGEEGALSKLFTPFALLSALDPPPDVRTAAFWPCETLHFRASHPTTVPLLQVLYSSCWLRVDPTSGRIEKERGAY